jgi:hypothetical protein
VSSSKIAGFSHIPSSSHLPSDWRVADAHTADGEIRF